MRSKKNGAWMHGCTCNHAVMQSCNLTLFLIKIASTSCIFFLFMS